MAWSVSADPVDFDDAIAWFRKRVAMTKADFERLSAAAKRKAFTVANVAQLDLIQQVWDAIDEAVKEGTPLADFKKAIGGELRKAWAGSVDDPPWRLETIFRTNVQNAYGAGRYRQATHPDVAGDRPVWMFDAILDGRTTDICEACDGTKLPNDDAWWKTHLPPLHFNCRSSFIALTDKQAGKITLVAPTQPPQDGFGLAPGESEWEPDPNAYAPTLAQAFETKMKAAPPVPPPSKMQAGVHAKRARAVAGVPKDAPDDLLGSVQDAELLKWLEQHPLSEVVARGSIRGANGQYVYGPAGVHRLEVVWNRKPWTFGKEWKPGAVHSISSACATEEQARRATFRHELGHHIHLFEKRGKVDQIIKAAYARARAARTFITNYAGTHPDEYFAESFAAYYLRRSELKAFDPNGYAMVEDVLRERGILP